MPAKVLVVDDDWLVLELVKDLLEEAGYAVVTLQSPQLIATVLEREKPHLMLVDVQMPDLGGESVVAFTKRFRRRYVQKIVLFSAESAERLAVLVQELGVDGFVQKGSLAGAAQAEAWLAQIKQYLPAQDPGSEGALK
jgi:DNA-binding response OmpR family regulator